MSPLTPHLSLSPSPAVFLHSSSFQTNSHPIVKASPPSAPRQLDSFLPDPRITPPFWKSRLSEDSLEKTICHSDTSLLPRCENSECFLDWFIPQSSFISFAQRPAGMNWVYILCVHTMSSANHRLQMFRNHKVKEQQQQNHDLLCYLQQHHWLSVSCHFKQSMHSYLPK